MSRRATSRGIIRASEIEHVFDAPCIARLARTGKLPAHADLRLFGEGVREAVRIYARDARTPNANTQRRQIVELHKAAAGRRFEKVAELLRELSPTARDFLNERGSRTLSISLPEPEDLLDGARREEACVTIERIAGYVGSYVEGRMRPSGVRSRTWRTTLYAPEPRRHFPRREAERDFLMWLSLAWLDAVGEPPSLAVNSDRPGPFARMVKECFELVGAGHIDVTGLINEQNRRRLVMEGEPA